MPAEPEARPRVLLIEDDSQLGPMIAQVLAEAYDVTLIADGAEGLAAGAHGEFEAMVIDRRLPSLDGLAVVEELRRKPGLHRRGPYPVGRRMGLPPGEPHDLLSLPRSDHVDG
jgi:CheY-like chemotaxis protein